jgi:T4-like virus tail tube protein gp19
MATGGNAAADDLIPAGYFELDLTGLQLKFTNVSGLTHSVNIAGSPVGSNTGAANDARTVSPPEPLRLTMQHVVLQTMDLWNWLKATMDARADATTKKTGTLSLMPMGVPHVALKTWNLDDVYLNSISLDNMGAAASAYLTATIEILVGQCKPM